VGSVIHLVLIALLALGVASTVRDTAVSIGFVLTLVYLPARFAQATPVGWSTPWGQDSK
jgi:ABC-2 type transport system permease protein